MPSIHCLVNTQRFQREQLSCKIDRQQYFLPVTFILESMCSYWLLYTVLLCDRWRRYKLIGCWSRWHALHSKTHHCRKCLQEPVSLLELSWDRAIYSAATFPVTVLSRCESLVKTELKKESYNTQNKTLTNPNPKPEREVGSGVASKEVSCYS